MRDTVARAAEYGVAVGAHPGFPDLEGFGRALSEVQEITGRWFASVQGGTFAPGASGELVRLLKEWGASGVGQSSWGPAVYGIAANEDDGRRLADRVSTALGSSGTVFEGPFRSEGARVWRAAVAEVKGHMAKVKG